MEGSEKFRMVAKTLFGLEEILAEEIRALGGENVKPLNRSVEFFGDKRLMYAANFRLRTATRVIKPIVVFRASDGDQLYSRAKRVAWSRHMSVDATFSVDALISHSGVRNSHYAALRVKDAVVDRFRIRYGRRPSIDLAAPDLRINLHLVSNVATLSIDSSGDPLFRRGYRTEGGAASVNEALAAGILSLAGWDGAEPLVDGMCGSGTFLIEAAMLAGNIAPGLAGRQYGFMRWPDYDRELWESLVAEARSEAIPEPGVILLGSDIDPESIHRARANADRAGVGDSIEFRRIGFEQLEPPPGPGVFVTNPPYGKRLPQKDIDSLYSSIGDTLKQKYDGYIACILTGNLPAAKKIGLKPASRIKLFNPPLECRLLKYEIYRGSRYDRRKKKTGDEPGQAGK